MLIVTTDRLSAFDVVLPDPIPGKGQLLTQISNFWFQQMTDLIPNHLTAQSLVEYLNEQECEFVKDRAIIVRKLKPLPVEAIVRGYLIGSGWKDYQRDNKVCGVPLPPGMKMAQQLAEPIYTPSTKAAVGDHDINIDFAETENLVGAELAAKIRDVSIEIYQRAAAYALDRGIIIADTKFEFGLDAEENLVLIDEVLTPDSSRFWPTADYAIGISPPSYDKQIIRDYLETLDWDKTPPGPKLPAEVIERTRMRYQEAFQKLTA